ncbi:hypothetical protein SDC9_98266 [bioreactor metagenome]|uniref:Uncharacterized protein n=1 Tax=bioreactor metagenome TaxID=1076179 RepID=A0A645AER4_9ZZZZ
MQENGAPSEVKDNLEETLIFLGKERNPKIEELSALNEPLILLIPNIPSNGVDSVKGDIGFSSEQKYFVTSITTLVESRL